MQPEEVYLINASWVKPYPYFFHACYPATTLPKGVIIAHIS